MKPSPLSRVIVEFADLDAIEGRVSIPAIAHRLRTVMGADRIVEMKDERVLEKGSWPDFIARKGELHRMASLQELA